MSPCPESAATSPRKVCKKTAVVLFNLGGPDDQASVRPFLFNLFHDPAIIRLSQPWRWFIAQLISTTRAPTARAIYRHLGGGSPLLANTQAQAQALKAALVTLPAFADNTVEVFICMRYWHPRAQAVTRQVAAFAPDETILLPLYPQFSTTTVASSLQEWQTLARRQGLSGAVRRVCCYPTLDGFIKAQADLIRRILTEKKNAPRVLFSAHGLPESVITQGDPYQWQCTQTATALAKALNLNDNDWVLCYQSRVGPKKWIGPSTEDEIIRAGHDGKALVVVPIAFVSDHSETLVELDIEYAELAHESGVVDYERVGVVAIHPDFIKDLANLVARASQTRDDTSPICDQNTRRCPAQWSGCPCTAQP